MEREILQLGNPSLYEISEEVKKEELDSLRPVFEDMFDCIRGIRRDYGFGRAIAAPQIGVKKRVICILTDKPYVIINPTLEFVGDEMMELLDDCMSFPGLLVRVKRYRHCILRYLDENWEKQEIRMDDDMAELIQHEYDHLDGILATMRAIDNTSFMMKNEAGESKKIQIEPLSEENEKYLLQIQRDDIPTQFVEEVSFTIDTVKYGAEHGYRGRCYAVKYDDNYVGILLIGEAIEEDADPDEVKAKVFFRILGFVIDSRYQRMGIGSVALNLAIEDIYREYGKVILVLECNRENQSALRFYEKNGFQNTGIINENDGDYYLIRR